MSLDGKTGSNLVNLDGKSDSNSITLLSGINISVIENPTDTYTINAIASGAEYSNTDNNLVIDNVSDIINLSTTINVSNISADLITSKNVQIGSFASGNNAVFSHKNYFNNLSYAFAQSPTGITLINSATDRIWVLKNMSLWGDLDASGNINASALNTSSLIIPDDTIKKNKIINLNTSLGSLSNYIGSLNTSVSGLSGDITTLNSNVSNMSSDIATLNTSVSGLSGDITTLNTSVSGLSGDITTLNSNVSNMSNDIVTLKSNVSNMSNDIGTLFGAGSNLSGDIATLNTNVSNLSNNKQDNITLIAGANISISKQNSSWTIESLASGGSQYSNIDNNLVIDNVSDTINLSTTINVSNISAEIITAGVTRIKTGNISDALFGNSELVDNTNFYAIRQLSNGKTYINSYDKSLTFRKTVVTTTNGKSVRTLGDMTWDGNTLLGNKLKFSEVNASTLTIPTNSITQDKISGLDTSLGNLSTAIGTLNTNVSNLSSNIANLNTSVSDLGNIETIARNWAQSSSPPDPNNASSKSSKTWASRSEEWAQGAGLPGGVGTLSAMGWSIAAGTASGTAVGAATAAGLSQTAAFNSAEAAALSAFAADESESNAGGYSNKSKDWAQSGLSPDPNNADAKSSKTWSNKSKDWAESTSEPGGQDTKSSKSWAGKSEEFRNNSRAWAQSDDEPGGQDSNTKSSKSWSEKSKDWAELNTQPGSDGTKSSKTWSNVAKDWAEKTTAPGGGTTKSSKSWSAISYNWAESSSQPGIVGTKSARSWAQIAKDWTEGTPPQNTNPAAPPVRSAKTIVNDFNNSLSTGLVVNYVKLGALPGGSDSQATFMNKEQYFPNATLADQIKKYCLMQDTNGISYLNSPLRIFMKINNESKMVIEEDEIVVYDNMSVNGELSVSKINPITEASSFKVQHVRIGSMPGGNADQATFMNKEQTYSSDEYPGDAEQKKTYCLRQDANGTSYLNSPSRVYIRIKNSDKITIEDDEIVVKENMSVNGELTVSKINPITEASSFKVQHARIGKLPGGNANQATFMNKEQEYLSNGYPGDAEQIKTYCLMQDVAGTSYLNSPTQTYIRIANEDKMEIVDNKIKMLVPLYIDDLNVSSAISDLNSNKQNNITLVAGANISITEDPADTFTIESTGSNLLSGTNNISVFNSSIDLSSNISTDNCSLKNLSANEITSGLARITTQTTGSSIAVFGNKSLTNLSKNFAIGQYATGQTYVQSYNNNINFRKSLPTGSSKDMVYSGDDLKVNNLKIGLIGSNVGLAHTTYFTTNGYAISQSSTGQTYLNSGTTKIIAVKGMDISGTTNISSVNASNISTKNLSADEITSGSARITGNTSGTDYASFGNISRPDEPAITQSSGGVVTINSYQNFIYLNKHINDGSMRSLYFTGTELVMSPVKIGGINGDAIFSNLNHYNIHDFALAQSDDGQSWLSSGTTSIKTLKGMDISGNINTSSINSSNASFDNLSIPDNALSKDKINGLNTSLDNLSITFEDPDGNNVNNNKTVIIPYDIQFLYPNLVEAVDESMGFKYVEIPYKIYYEDIRGSDAVYHESATDKRTVIIPDVIDFVNVSNQNIVNVTNNTRSVIVPEYINFIDTYGNSVIQDVQGVNTITLNNAAPTDTFEQIVIRKAGFSMSNDDDWVMHHQGTSFDLKLGGVTTKLRVNADGNTFVWGDLWARDSTTGPFMGFGALGSAYACWARGSFRGSASQYAMIQDAFGNVHINGNPRLYLKHKNNTKMYIKGSGVYTSNNVNVNSDDRLKYDEQDISGLNVIRQLNPKKYIKIDLPFVKKKRRYYDKNDITIIDDYIEDICMNEINDISFNEYYDDDDYIHKEIIEEEDVDEFVSEEDISNGQVEVGLIAQDVLETDISFVVTQQDILEDMNGKPLFQPYAVDYGSVMPYCIQAIKDLDTIVQGLKDKINNLEAENNILEARVHELENV